MLKYIAKALKRFNHKAWKTMQYQTHPHVPTQYDKQIQYASVADTWPKLDKQQQKFIQEVKDLLILCQSGRRYNVDRPQCPHHPTSKPNRNNDSKTKQFLVYAASNSNATLTYNASEMVLAIHNDASYFNEKQAQSRAGWHFFISNTDVFPQTKEWFSTQHKQLRQSCRPQRKQR